jgi:hypothetical protein
VSDINPFASPTQFLDGFAPLYPSQGPGLDGLSWANSSVPYVGGEDPYGFVEPPAHTKCMHPSSRSKGLCQGPRAKGTEFCVGHLRSMGRLDASAEVKVSDDAAADS